MAGPSSDTAQGDYWDEARRPLAALLFLLPLLALYECGLLFLGGDQPAALRNGADSWMRAWLVYAGVQHPWLLPAVVIALLGGWHLLARHPWRCSMDTLVGMFAESLLFALGLVVFGQLLNLAFMKMAAVPMDLSGDPASRAAAVRAVSFVGAGIYEEVMFRLALLPLCVAALRPLMSGKPALTCAVLLSSVVFATAHYVEPSGPELWLTQVPETVERVFQTQALWFSFTFRAVAGVVFAVLFLRRGFGVTVGCHALYDVLVGVIMQPAS